LRIDIGYHDKYYGLTGQTIMVRERGAKPHKKGPDALQLTDLSENEKEEEHGGINKVGRHWKFTWGGVEVPVFVNGEYRKFLDCTVLPHRNIGGGISRPYPVTIDKFDIFRGVVIINGGAIK